jgi:hypothetical protein
MLDSNYCAQTSKYGGRIRQLLRRFQSYLADTYWGLVIVSLIIVVVSSAAGLYLEKHGRLEGFVGNLLSETAGIFFGIIVTLLVVDAYMNYRRKRQWAKVRNYTLGAIAAHLSDFASDVYVFLGGKGGAALGPIIDGRDEPRLETVSGFETLASDLRSIHGDIGNKSPSDCVVELYEHSRWELDQIQAILIPRVMQSQAEQDLVDALIEFDEAHRDLRSQIIAHRLICTQSAFPALISLVEVSGKLYGVLCKHWKV